jgi:hypothetical protein
MDLHVCSNDGGGGRRNWPADGGHLHERRDGESLERFVFFLSFLLCFAVLEHGSNHAYGPGLRTLMCHLLRTIG